MFLESTFHKSKVYLAHTKISKCLLKEFSPLNVCLINFYNIWYLNISSRKKLETSSIDWVKI